MNRCGVAVLLVAGLLWHPTGARGAGASPVSGTWAIRDLVLDLYECQNLVCGRIAWINDANRRPTQCNKTIVWGLAFKGAAEWGDGSILDPDDGRTYRLAASLQPDGELRARIYKGVPLFGKTEILRRVDPQTIGGHC